MNDVPIATEPDQTGAPKTRDYFAEMYIAGVLADAGWDIYFPRRDRGFDMIVSRPAGDTTIVRPVQVKGKYASDEKTNKASYGYVGRMTAFHSDMILAIPYFTSRDAAYRLDAARRDPPAHAGLEMRAGAVRQRRA